MRLRAALIASALALLPSRALASPEDLFGFGARSPAMGGTGTAWSSDYEAAYTNVALLSRIREQKLTLGFQSATFDLHADGEGLPGRVETLPAKGIVVGVGVPIPFGGVLKDRIATGFAFYTPTDVLVRARILYPETPDYGLLADRSQSLTVRMGTGADLGYGVRVGAGVASLAALVGTITVVSAGGGTIGAHVDDQLVATYAPTFGASWDLPLDEGPGGERRWRVGATWRGELYARFGVAVDMSKVSTLPIPVFNIAGLAQYDPSQAAIELAHERGPWSFALGVTYKRWSGFPGPWEATIPCDQCGALTPPHVIFQDTFVPRFGVDRSFAMRAHATAHLRAGFFYEPTPVPSTLPPSEAYLLDGHDKFDVPTRYFDADRAVYSLGGGVDMGGAAPFTIDTWAQYHALSSTTVQSPTPNVPLHAPTEHAATLSGHVIAWGIVAGVKF